MTDHQADIEAVLSLRHDNGADYWATPDGRLGVGGPFSTLESLLILHELGLDAEHEAVAGGLELLLSTSRDDGRFRPGPKGAIYPCHTANIVRVLCRFGMVDDVRVQRALDHLLQTPFDDGGWRCNKFIFGKGRETQFSNPGVTLIALDAFRFSDHLNANPALDRAVDTLLDHWTVRAPMGPCHFGIGTLFMQTEYPFLRYNLFSYVYVLSFYQRAGRDERFQQASAMLDSKLDGEGKLIVERPNRKLAKLKAFAPAVGSVPATRRYREIQENLAR